MMTVIAVVSATAFGLLAAAAVLFSRVLHRIRLNDDYQIKKEIYHNCVCQDMQCEHYDAMIDAKIELDKFDRNY